MGGALQDAWNNRLRIALLLSVGLVIAGSGIRPLAPLPPELPASIDLLPLPPPVLFERDIPISQTQRQAESKKINLDNPAENPVYPNPDYLLEDPYGPENLPPLQSDLQ